jgi:hypothetical protein
MLPYTSKFPSQVQLADLRRGTVAYDRYFFVAADLDFTSQHIMTLSPRPARIIDRHERVTPPFTSY